MKLRTFYWNDRKVSRLQYLRERIRRREKLVFRYGNTGDIFNTDLIRYLYNIPYKNVKNEGSRLLLVGSVMNVVSNGDVICGIGSKGNPIENEKLSSVKIWGVRGPLTKKILGNAGAELSGIKFQLDPGLLIKEVYNLNVSRNSSKNVLFIPHYADHWHYKRAFPSEFKIVNADNTPKKVAKEIAKAKVVYSSSLHGIIFAHALQKECVFVRPQSDESLFKYRDYFESIGLEMPDPISSIYDYDFASDQTTTSPYCISIDDFTFPSIEELVAWEVIK